MTIHIHLDALMVKHKIKLAELAEQVGITVANLSVLKSGRAKAIRFSTLSSLCHVLKCQPGELISYEPDPVKPIETKITIF